MDIAKASGPLHQSDEIRMAVNTAINSPSTSIEIEIGSSSGGFLISIARSLPDRFFLGIEVDYWKTVTAAMHAKNSNINNVLFFNREGYDFLKRFIPNSIISRIHIYFPTPNPSILGLGPKLIRREFIEEMSRVLVPAGEVRLLTDHRSYFERAITLFDQNSWLGMNWTPLPLDLKEGMLAQTGCETKYRIHEQAEIFNLTLKSLKDW